MRLAEIEAPDRRVPPPRPFWIITASAAYLKFLRHKQLDPFRNFK